MGFAQILEEMNDEDQLHDALQLFDRDRNSQIDLAEVSIKSAYGSHVNTTSLI